MKKAITTLIILFATCGIAFAIRGAYQDTNAGAFDRNSRTQSPYFIVQDTDNQTGESETELLPLKSTDVDVSISGVIANVEICQLYRNNGNSKLECIYVFPGSTRAAIHGMEFTIGDRKVVAQIQKKEDAKAQYEQAKKDNKTAALLEQERPNVFKMSVGHILPGDEIEVTLKYSEHLLAADKIYEFVFPTVVGPRYVGRDSEPDIWVANPYLAEGTPTPATFDINVALNAGMPLNYVACDTHPVDVKYESDTSALLALQPDAGDKGDRDFIFKYRLAGEKIATGLLLHEDKKLKENFFLLTVQPPKAPRLKDIPGRDYTFIMDVSGSMSGFPLDTSKNLLRELIGDLRKDDTFNVLFFAGASHLLSNTPLPANKENINRAIDMIDNQRGGGGTELLPALKRAFDLNTSDAKSRSVIIVTDGLVNVERKTFDLIRDHLNEVNVFAFGIGSSVNRYLIEGIARAGQGEPFVVTEKKHAKAEAARLRKLLESPVMTDIEITFDAKFDAYDIEPRTYPDVFADRPIVVFGKYRGDASGGDVKIAGLSGDKKVELSAPISEAASSDSNEALPYLWARNRIATLSDYISFDPNADEKDEVTNLGLTYNLMTRYTSFIAVDEVVRTAENLKSKTVKQSLPLPKGVPNTAVGGGTIPEPTMPILLLIAAIAGIFSRKRRETLED